MASSSYLLLAPQDGIQRDGSTLDSLQYTDGQWVRSYNNRAKKKGGYKTINLGTDKNEIIRTLASFNATNSILLYMGRPSSLTVMNVYTDLSTTVPIDRTPVGFVSDPNNTWSISSVAYDDNNQRIDYVLATACPNGSDISNSVEGIVYYGNMTSSNALQPIVIDGENLTAAGGVTALGDFVVVYTDSGFYKYNDGQGLESANWPTQNFGIIGSSKIVYGCPIRQSSSVTGLFWTLDYVFTLTLDTTELKFVPAYVSTSSTVLAPTAIISFDPMFYWIGTNNFYMYNGAVNVLPNNTNKLWFFENLNIDAKEKIRGFYNKKYNEISWLVPMFGSTENNWEIFCNLDTQSWWDSPLTRSAAVSSSSQFPYPIMSSSSIETINNVQCYPIWVHEYGVNKVTSSTTTAILSYFTTNKLYLLDQNPAATSLNIDCLIPDIKQTGDMFFQVNAQGYPNSPVQTSDSFSFSNATEFQTVRVKGTILSLTFTSNVLDGDYLMGKTLVKLDVTDDQRIGPSTT